MTTFQPLPSEHELSAASANLRSLGQARVIVQAHRLLTDGEARDNEIADEYTVFLGYRALGMPWVAVPPDELSHALSVLLSKDMAYGVESMDEAVAREAVDRWLAFFSRSPRAYTNGELLLEHAKPYSSGAAYNPIVGATFDTGAIVIAADVVGFFWATDED